MYAYRIHLLGRFDLLVDGRSVLLARREKELLTYLLLQRQRSAFRHQLSGALWPETQEERALQNLSTCLWRLRKALRSATAQELVHCSRAMVSLLTSQVWVDYWEFDELARHALSDGKRISMERAIELYKGDLVQGEIDADWLMQERERARLTFLKVLSAHAWSLLKMGETTEALRTFEQLMVSDPLNEEACRGLMLLHYLHGNSTEALRIYHAFAERLRMELGVLPDEETRRLHKMIRSGRLLGVEAKLAALSNGSGGNGGIPPMVGRSGELRDLWRMLDVAGEGRGVVVGIEGEAGIGKTRLIVEFSREAASKGWRVLQATCEEFPRGVPYKPFYTLVDVNLHVNRASGARASSQPFPDPAALNLDSSERGNLKMTSEERAAFMEAVASWLRRQAEACPTVLVIEDLQYADSASIDVLAYLRREIRNCRLAIILTWRPEDSASRVTKLTRSDGFLSSRMQLTRLSEAEIRGLCRIFAGDVDAFDRVAEHVFRESEGNPLFALEILKSLTLRGGKSSAGGSALGVRPGRYRVGPSSLENILPPAIRRAVRKRLDRLPSRARRLLAFASACGRSLDLELLSQALRLTKSELAFSLRSLGKLGFIGAYPDGFRFQHEKIREFCYEGLSAADRASIHASVVAALEAFWPDRLGELAFHSERAGQHAKAGAYWEVLGDRATMVWAHRDAVKAYSRAMESWMASGQLSDEARFELLRKRACAWELSEEIERGQGDIEDMLLIALRTHDEVKRCETLTFQSRLLLRRGLYKEARERAQDSLQLATAIGDPNLMARAREAVAFSYFRSGEYDQAVSTFLDLVSTLELLGAREPLERVWNRIGCIQAAVGDVKSLSSLDRAERFASGDLNERALRNMLRGQTLAFMGRRDQATTALRFAENDYRRAGNLSGKALVNAMLALVSGCSGDFVSAVKHAREGLPFKCGRAEAYWRVVSTTSLGHGVWLELGNYRTARKAVMKDMNLLPQIGGRSRANLLDLAAVVALEQGDVDAAHSFALRALSEVMGTSDQLFGICLTTLGRVNMALGQAERAVDLLRVAVDLLDTETNHLELTQACSWLAVACQRAGRLDEAMASSERAVNLLAKRKGFAYQPQEVLWNHFSVLRSCGASNASLALREAYGIVTDRASRLGGKMRARFLSIPVNREIVNTWEKAYGRGQAMQDQRQHSPGAGGQLLRQGRVYVLIPRAGAPWGRPLRDGEYVEVIWTVDAGRQDQALKELKGEVGLRRARILRLCAEASVQGGEPREEDLARVLGVSTRTIRADIAWLRSQGCILQTRGTHLH